MLELRYVLDEEMVRRISLGTDEGLLKETGCGEGTGVIALFRQWPAGLHVTSCELSGGR